MTAMVVILLFIIMGILVIAGLAIAILTIVGEWKVFEKAGKPGWAALIPIYDTFVLYQIGGVNPYFAFINLGYSVFSMFQSLLSSISQASRNDSSSMIFALLSLVLAFIVLALSIAMLVFKVMASLGLARKFGKSGAYGVGIALLPFVFFPMLGFDKEATYNPEIK